jgi:hypothetical protein
LNNHVVGQYDTREILLHELGKVRSISGYLPRHVRCAPCHMGLGLSATEERSVPVLKHELDYCVAIYAICIGSGLRYLEGGTNP